MYTRMKKLLLIHLPILFLLTITIDVCAQIHDFDSLVSKDESFKNISSAIYDTLDLFNSDVPLIVTMQSDFKNLVKRKYKEEYQEAIFKVMLNDSVQVTRDIKIKARGNMRKSTCLIPPLKLNFPKKKAFIKQMESFDKIKMVLDCKRGETYEQYLLLEYYAYKIQNIINDYSLRVRLMHVTYIDVSGKFKNLTRYAFIIESVDQLAARHNAMRIETKSIRDNLTDVKTLADAYLFQYLIGNTDWSIPAMHNIYLIKSKDFSYPKPYAIPFDFDYAGIVNTMYATPDEHLGTDDVRERVYRGVCIPENNMIMAKDRFIEKKLKIYDLLNNDSLLNKSNKRSTIIYIDEFYTILESKNAFRRNILDSCRQ